MDKHREPATVDVISPLFDVIIACGVLLQHIRKQLGHSLWQRVVTVERFVYLSFRRRRILFT